VITEPTRVIVQNRPACSYLTGHAPTSLAICQP